jgi:hypothetical protein
MAKFTKADDITVPQSVGPRTAGGNLNSTFQVFEPHQGRELIYKNPQMNDGSVEVVQDFDERIPLGTYTLNNRDTWENNNFNELTFQPYLTEEYAYRKSYKFGIWGSARTGSDNFDGDIVLPSIPGGAGDYNESNTTKFSVEALPFVINPNNQDIIHLDRYYDKEIDKENYELATEGKINLKFEVKRYGRIPPENIPEGTSTYGDLDYLNNFGMNIDIFSNRYPVHNYIDNSVSGQRSWSMGENDGIYLFKLNWNDGTELEHTSEPKLLEDTVLFEHHYEKPGFYSITGVVYRVQDGQLKTWEKFQTNILLNPSPNYELNLFDYTNFASIGGISKDSAFVKSLYNIVGINALTQDNERARLEVIEKLNTLDKIQILNVLSKVDYDTIKTPGILNYEYLIEPYSKEIIDESVEGFIEVAGAGCVDSNATNFDSAATQDDGTCNFSFDVEVNNVETEQTLDYNAYFIPGGLSPADNLPDTNFGEGEINAWWEDSIQNGETLPTNFPISLIQNTSGNLPKVFIKFTVSGTHPDGIVGLTDTQSNFSLLPTIVIDGTDDAHDLVLGWYRLVYNSEPGPNNYGGDDHLEEVNFQIYSEFTGDDDPDDTIDAVLYSGLTATLTGDNSDWYFVNSAGETQWIPYGSDTPVDQWTTTDHGWYHIHASGKIHIGASGVGGGDHGIPEDELIEQGAPPPPQEYTIVLHNSPLSGMGETGTVYSKVRFPSGVGVNNTIGIPNGFPQGDAYISGLFSDSLTLSTNVSGTNALLNAGSVVTIEGLPENDRNAWGGWYSDAGFTNLLTLDNTHTFTVYTFGTEVYGSPTNTTIHLYAKVLTGI